MHDEVVTPDACNVCQQNHGEKDWSKSVIYFVSQVQHIRCKQKEMKDHDFYHRAFLIVLVVKKSTSNNLVCPIDETKARHDPVSIIRYLRK
tara:strand:+ start:5321 stop:5593 length:273 start_codon:yes stop_codon:yes gene_type:complete